MPTKPWEARAMAILKKKKGKYLSADLIRKVEKGVAARVPVAEFRAWVAQLIEDKGLKVATGRAGQQQRQPAGEGATPRIPELASTASRMDMVNIGKGGSSGEYARLRHAVRKWVHQQTWGAVRRQVKGKDPVGEGVLSPPQVLRAVKGLGKRGVTADQVRGTIAVLACEEGWEVGMWRKRVKRDMGDWLVRGLASLQAKGWVTVEAVNEIMPMARKVVTEWKDRMTVISFGSGWEGDVEGFERVVRVIRNDIARQYKGTMEGWTVPQLMLDFTKGEGRLVQKACQEAGICPQQNLGGHFSPECLTQTIIMFLELANGRGQGVHANKAPCPVASLALREIVTGILHYLDLYPEWSFTLEQPKGTAMATHAEIKRLERALKIQPVEVRMCAYGYKWQKPTMIWTNLGKHWTPRSLTQHCAKCRDNTRHEMRIVRRNNNDKRPAAQLKGFTQEASRNRIAPLLAQDWAKAMLAKRMEGRKHAE